jgi:hypothetical protein
MLLRLTGVVLGYLIHDVPGLLSSNPDQMAENLPKYLVWAGGMLGAIPPDVLAAITSEPGRWAFNGMGLAVIAGFNVPSRYLPWGSRSTLTLFSGAGDPYEATGGAYPTTDPDLVYRIGIKAAPNTPVTGIKVTVQACDPPGAFAINTPLQLMHGYDPNDGFDLDGGEEKNPQLLDVWVKRRRTPHVQPSHAIRVAPRRVLPGKYTITVVATASQGSLPCSRKFGIEVHDDLTAPVTIRGI